MKPLQISFVLCLLVSAAALVAPPVHAQRVMENLGRAVVAVRTDDSSVYVGWRLLATDPEKVGFDVYRSTAGAPPVKLNGAALTNTTDFVDATAEVRNTGTAPAKDAHVQSLTIVQSAGDACTPAVVAPASFPIDLGDIAPGSTAAATITLDLSSCTPSSRFAVHAPLSAMDGAATSLLIRSHESP